MNLKCRQNQDRFIILGQACQMPDDGAGGDRRREGVSRTQAFAWNCRNQALDAKGESSSGVNREVKSTDAPVRGGLLRSSDEAG